MNQVAAAIQARESEHEGGYAIEAQRLRIRRTLTRKEWVALGKLVARHVDGGAWALGDWLLEGGRENRNWYGGSTYEIACRITGLSASHLSNAYRTALAYPPDSRYPELSWSTHKIALRVPPELRGRVLKLAIAKQWTSDDVNEHINGLAASQKAEGVSVRKSNRDYAAKGGGYLARKVRCPNQLQCRKCGTINPCRYEFPIKGHKV